MKTDRQAPVARALGLALALVDLMAPVVPRSRRDAWRRQWAADLWYQWAFLVDQQGATARSGAELARRAAGSVPHALALRLRSWSQPMLMNDVRYGVRMLAKRPGFTATAILILGLGVGANATIFSWVEAFLLTPLPGVADADRLVSVHGTTRTRRNISLSWPNFADMRDAKPAGISGMAAHRAVAINVRTTGDPERAWAELVSADFFDVVGVPAALGRALVPDDDRAPGASAVAVLSHDYWQHRFAGDPGVVGTPISINGRPFTIVGVAPEGFRGAMAAIQMDLWVPMMMQEVVTAGDRLTARGNAWLDVVARLSPGATIAEAQAGLSVTAAQLAAAWPDVNEDRGVAVYPLWRDPSSATAILAPVLGLLMAVVGIVLLIACANLANLLLARGAGRQREVAVRLALGASRRRIVAQLMTESALLALAGAAVGLAVAAWTSRLLGAFVPPTPLPIVTDANVSPGVFLFGVALALATTVVFGLAPALQASRPELVPSLKETLGAIGTRRRAWIRATLVVAQVSLSVVLLVGAGLFVRTLQNTEHADVGFDLEDGLLASIDLLPAGYDQARGTAFFKALRARVAAIPGVESAALARDIPLKLGGGSDTSAEIEGYEPAPGEEITLFYDRVSPGYFETMGIELVSGRPLADTDTEGSARVVVINETMAKRYWKGQDPVGKRLRLGDWATVVGVVRDVTYTTVGAPPVSFMYLPVYQWYRPDTTLVVRTAAEPIAVAGSIRAALRSLDPNLPLFDVRTMTEHRDMAVFIPRLAATLLGAFGVLALLLATVGLYGLLAFTVSQRTQEIGVRVALGARREDILHLIVGQGLRLTLAGVAIGLAVALAAMPLVASQLVGVGARDGWSYAMTSLVLVAAAAVATYLPARRAAAVDPLRALRYE